MKYRKLIRKSQDIREESLVSIRRRFSNIVRIKTINNGIVLLKDGDETLSLS